MAELTNNNDISLLYPMDYVKEDKVTKIVSPYVAEQLELYYLIDLKTCDVIDFVTDNIDVIKYRQQTFEDISNNPDVIPVLNKMIPLLNDISDLRRMNHEAFENTESYLYSITEIEIYLSILELLKNKLLPLASNFKSEAFVKFTARVKDLTESEYYTKINNLLVELTSRVREIKSVTIGVNLDEKLSPVDGGVLSLNNEAFKSGQLIDRVLRLDFKKDERTCIAPLVPFRKNASENQQTALTFAFNNAINEVFKSSVKQWKKIIQSYVLDNTDFLLKILPEIEFISKSYQLVADLKELGLNLVYPEIISSENKAFSAKELINPVVALKVKEGLVPNDIDFDDNGKIYVITGPNRGGKSVLTCAVGLTFILAQLGLPVCAKKVTLSPCDKICTHFPQGSDDTINKGRLGEECARLNEIFNLVSSDSLVLLDESLSSTGSYEATYIAKEVLSGLSLVGCRTIFSTHLHELAASIDEINTECLPQGGVKIDSLVAAIDSGKRSFKILRKKPDGMSYAKDIAEKYGLSSENILKTIKAKKK